MKLVLADQEEKLHALQKMIKQIVGDVIEASTTEESIAKTLLMSEPFTCTYAGGIITGVYHDGSKPSN